MLLLRHCSSWWPQLEVLQAYGWEAAMLGFQGRFAGTASTGLLPTNLSTNVQVQAAECPSTGS